METISSTPYKWEEKRAEWWKAKEILSLTMQQLIVITWSFQAAKVLPHKRIKKDSLGEIQWGWNLDDRKNCIEEQIIK